MTKRTRLFHFIRFQEEVITIRWYLIEIHHLLFAATFLYKI